MRFKPVITALVAFFLGINCLACRPCDGCVTGLPTDSVPAPIMGLSTNLLYDAAMVPNAAFEIQFCERYSFQVSGMYAWWTSRRHDFFWRIYGADATFRVWFAPHPKGTSMSGHHVGAVGGAYTYDFEVGGKGYMGGQPRHGLLNKAHVLAGLEYGYSLPIKRRLNLDFSMAFGYAGGIYHEYTPMDGHYVWTATKRRTYFGPIRAAVSLVWLFGPDNANRKGGSQ